MSVADEIVHAHKEGDTFKSEASEEPTNDDEKEIANKDSCDLQHQDNSKKILDENLESQVQTQFVSKQDEVKTISGQDKAQAGDSGQPEVDSDTDKAQTKADNGTSDKAMNDMDQVYIQESTTVEDTVGTNVDEIQSQGNSGEEGTAKSEIGQIQIQDSDDGQGEAWSETQQVQEQIDRDEQAEALSVPGNVEGQSSSGEHTETLSKSSQVEDQLISGQNDEVLNELGQVEDHPTNGQDEAQSEKVLVQDQGGQGEVQCESGQDQVNNDEKDHTKSGKSQDQLKALDGRKVKAKGAMCTIKSVPTSGRAGLLTRKRFPTFNTEKRRFIMGGSSGIFAKASSASGQDEAKNVPSKSKFQTKSIENVKLDAAVAEKVEPEPDEDKNHFSSETINSTHDTQNSSTVMMNADDKDQFPAKKDVTKCTESSRRPASGGTLASKEGKSVTKFWCDICKLVCASALNLQMHFLGFKHKKIEAALKWNVNNAEGVTKDEFLAPMEMRTVEDHLNKMKLNKAVLGLDYVVEYRYDQKTNPQFVCKLCHCKSELTWFLPHLLGTKHMANYLEKHYPGSLNYEGEKLKTSEWKEFVNKKALEIEKKDGRGKVTVVQEKIDTKGNEKSAVKRVAEQSIVEPERKLQKSEATPEKTKTKDQPMPSPNEDLNTSKPKLKEEPSSSQVRDIPEDETWTGMYLYPDGLPINLPLDSKLVSRSVRAHQGASTARGAAAVNDLPSSIGSKILEDHIKKYDFEEAIIGLDFLTEYHYKRKTEPLYFCELCNCQMPLQCVLAHIFGIKHKMNYVKRKHPDLLKVGIGKYKQIVKKKAAELEKIDGRGKLKVIRDYDGPSLSKKIAATKDGSQLQDMEYSSFDQDQSTSMETSYSSDPKNRKPYASTSFKPSSRVTSSKAESWSDPKYSRCEPSTSKHVETRKRESSKDIRHSGEDWRDEWEQSIKRPKSTKEDRMEREKSKHFDRDQDRRQESKWDSGEKYKKQDESRRYQDDDHRGYDTSYQAPEKYIPSRPEDIVKKEILGFLANFKVINDTDARYVKGIMYKLSNQLLQFGQRALQLTGSADKLIEETKNPSSADEHPRFESRRAGILGNFPAQSAVQNAATSMSSIQNNLLTPSLLNSFRGMDVNTITSTLTRLAANNPAFEGLTSTWKIFEIQ
ncbi:uncharacterized protein si:ch211-197h24.6 isoform X2 [Pristis pectinata]|uniref:uncharacterized protein si:ch211-197h24.6 isoform X2 n=1 Tax=Pristis pectinata TaxID=685728 RepID=UPI00223D75A9|nr:uncharacterized protein si:ch211-197h24.6 isoform X2 [Pristis pectinata]